MRGPLKGARGSATDELDASDASPSFSMLVVVADLARRYEIEPGKLSRIRSKGIVIVVGREQDGDEPDHKEAVERKAGITFPLPRGTSQIFET